MRGCTRLELLDAQNVVVAKGGDLISFGDHQLCRYGKAEAAP